MFSRILNKSPQSAPSLEKLVINESIAMFHTILRNDKELLEAFEWRESLKKGDDKFPKAGDGSKISELRAALAAIDSGDTTIYRRHDEARESVIVGAAEFARFRQHMKTSEALIYEAAVFTAVTKCLYLRDLSGYTEGMDQTAIVSLQQELQAQILKALQFEILRLEYESKTAQTTALIEDPATPPSIKARASELLAEGWETKKDKSLDTLHAEMLLIKNDFDAIHQMMEATKAAYEEAKSKLSARLADERTLTAKTESRGLCAMKEATDCEQRQTMSLAYERLRGVLLECCDKMDKETADCNGFLDESVRQLELTLTTLAISQATKQKIKEQVRQFNEARQSESLRVLVLKAEAMLYLKSEIQNQVKADEKAYAELLVLSNNILACYDIPTDIAQLLRHEISNPDGSRPASERREVLERCYNAANSAKIERPMEIKTPLTRYGRYAAGSRGTAFAGYSVLYEPVATNSHGLFNHSTQNQYKNKQLLLGIGLILLGATVLSITIMSAIATFGASAPLAALALPLSMSLAASGVAILGMAGLGLAGTGGYALSK